MDYVPPPVPDGFFWSEDPEASPSYTDILNNVKKFQIVFEKMIKSALSKGKVKEEILGEEELDRCTHIHEMFEILTKKSGVKDGSQFSLAKIKKSSTFYDYEWLLELEGIADSSFSHCEEKIAKIVNVNLKELRKFVTYKEFDDGFKQRIR